ncbi:hypothetical protein RUM43_005880 [Polyplax serrata]|uniref:Dynein intermediate chain 3, ciliary n=1 Tax=Polyplax serrata TaxID=468196 RepID=A0AAN8PXU6_POLSC
MEPTFAYVRKRMDFGKQCLFTDDGPNLTEDFKPNRKNFEDYIFKNPVSRETQYSSVQAQHEVNTTRAEFVDRGMNHVEGGWAKDINMQDAEQTLRYRKKVEKDEEYIRTILQLSNAMEHYILQNNAVNIYESYFEDSESGSLVERSTSRTINVYKDPCSLKRPVTHLSWSAGGGNRLAVTHCNLEFQRASPDLSTHSYIWETENPNKPQMTLVPVIPIVCLEYNPKDPNILISGMFSGQVCFWDTRKGSEPVETSPLELSHRYPVHNVLWINSKSGTEFFSASSDGQIKWWDNRKLSESLETLVLDVQKGETALLSRALGASSLEYETTIPTRFMVGTENGYVIQGNRKGKTPQEKLAGVFKAHLGPVCALQRNTAFVKNFLTVGDWTARIWSEDCKESSIMWTRCCTETLLYFVRNVCDDPLRSLRAHENGRLVAVGNEKGSTYLVEFSENLATNNKNDKALLTAMFERESRREKILEARMRELRLKGRVKPPDLSGAGGQQNETVEKVDPCKQAEIEFFAAVEKEMEEIKKKKLERKREKDDTSAHSAEEEQDPSEE